MLLCAGHTIASFLPETKLIDNRYATFIDTLLNKTRYCWSICHCWDGYIYVRTQIVRLAKSSTDDLGKTQIVRLPKSTRMRSKAAQIVLDSDDLGTELSNCPNRLQSHQNYNSDI